MKALLKYINTQLQKLNVKNYCCQMIWNWIWILNLPQVHKLVMLTGLFKKRYLPFVKAGTFLCVTKMIIGHLESFSFWAEHFLWIQSSVLFNSKHQLTFIPERNVCVLEWKSWKPSFSPSVPSAPRCTKRAQQLRIVTQCVRKKTDVQFTFLWWSINYKLFTY